MLLGWLIVDFVAFEIDCTDKAIWLSERESEDGDPVNLVRNIARSREIYVEAEKSMLSYRRI